MISKRLEDLGIPRLFVYGVIKSITVSGQSGGLSVADVYLNGATTASTNIPVNPDVAPHLSAGDPVWVIRVNFDSRDMFVLCRHNGNNNLTFGGSGNGSGYITVEDTYGNTIVTIDNNGIKMYDTNGVLRFWSVPNDSGGGNSMGTTQIYGALYAQSTTNFGTTNTNFFGALTADGVVVFGATVDGAVYSKNNELDDGSGSASIVKDLTVGGNFAVTGSKSALVNTKDYGKQLLYAIESPYSMFEDITESATDTNGTVTVNLEPIFMETVDTSNSDYHVYVQGIDASDFKVTERNPDHFVVTGSPNSKFMCRILAKRLGYENVRFNPK